MSPAGPTCIRARIRRAVLCLLAAAALGAGGCRSWHRLSTAEQALRDSPVTLPAARLGNYLVVEGRIDRGGPYHFIIDTGASVSLLSPGFAARYGVSPPPGADAPRVRVQGADGRQSFLPTVQLRRLELGGAEFTDVPALVYDLESLSLHLGRRIDGILGFPVFRDVVLTLDYPASRVTFAAPGGTAERPGHTLHFALENRTPLVPVQIGDQSVIALIDTGSDGGLVLNPLGLVLTYLEQPRPGALIATLTGERGQLIGRLTESMQIGPFTLETPLVDLTEGLSSIGGEILRHFTVTFDQQRNEVTLHRNSSAPIPAEPKRSIGLSFHKTGPYWRVGGVVPESPAERQGIEQGDLCVRINGEPVEQWTHSRFLALIESAPTVRLTFLHGVREEERTLEVFELVPLGKPEARTTNDET